MDPDLVRRFQLVEFIQKGPKKLRPVDCVPTKWIRYDKIKKDMSQSSCLHPTLIKLMQFYINWLNASLKHLIIGRSTL